MSDFLGSFLPPPPPHVSFLPSNVRFVGVILDPPTLPKIGHHLCTFPFGIFVGVLLTMEVTVCNEMLIN